MSRGAPQPFGRVSMGGDGMSLIEVGPLRDDLAFGATVKGISWETLKDAGVRKQLMDLLEDRGMILFEDVERSTPLQVELSQVFGPLQNHPLKAIARVDRDNLPGVIDINVQPEDASIVELNGQQLSCWAPWHFDNSYTKHLCRAAILRALDIPPEGGMTGFADGIQLYKAISPELRAAFEDLKIVYDPNMLLSNLRFGMPEGWRYVHLATDGVRLLETTANSPRSVHPAVWTRPSGERVLHVSLQTAAGIHGRLDAEGDALLEALFAEMAAKMAPYWHQWRPNDMLVFDNWRFIHAISGNDPKYARRMHRTTIEGDYGLGNFEKELEAA
jgi:taurine dioxygenase